jgi:hypothetical protein
VNPVFMFWWIVEWIKYRGRLVRTRHTVYHGIECDCTECRAIMYEIFGRDW